MVITRAAVVAEARSWVNTRWAHQQCIKGVAVDCANFISEVLINAGGVSRGLIEELMSPRDYRPSQDGTRMLGVLAAHGVVVGGRNDEGRLEGLELARMADVMAFVDDGGRLRHLGFITRTEPLTLIHASRPKVVEHRLDGSWLVRAHSIWGIPGIEE